jgi:hypothetical protein
MIKDFVPAKANLSTGLVINTNILERNKIARHEPVMTFVNYSGSIETAFITGSNGLDEIYNTAYTSSTTYISGSITKYNNDNRELFTGELGGTTILVHSQSLDNIVYELNNIAPNTSSSIYDNFYRLPINPTLNNVLIARTSPQYLDVDYGYSSILPVNINFLTASLNANLNSAGYKFLNAPVQDSNYTLKRHINPRYNGSRLFSSLYNIYSSGDISYGNSPVIDLTPIKFAYFREITSQSLTFPGRVNVNTKYLIDSASNVVELTEANENLFDIQSIFAKSDVNIALDNINQPTKQKSLNGFKPIYAGGFRYEPILQNFSNLSSTHSSLEFSFLDDIPITNPASGSIVTASINGMEIDPNPILTSEIIQNPPLNTLTTPLNVTINSGITFRVTRTTAAEVEIVQRVTGSVKLTIKVSPPNDEPVLLYTGYDFGGEVISISRLGFVAMTDYNIRDFVGSIRVPAGKSVLLEDEYRGYNAFVVNGPGSNSGRTAPLVIDNRNGLDDIRVSAFSISASFEPGIVQNTFKSSAPLVSLNTGSGIYSIEETDGLVIEATYPFEGEIILERGEEGPIDIKLRNLEGSIGNFDHRFKFTKSPNDGRGTPIRFASPVTSSIIRTNLGTNYYFTQAPNLIYITGSSDNGYNSLASQNNWYFERGNKVVSGSVFTMLTASYDLSKLYYDHYIPGTDYYGNYLKQILPSQSLVLGYQDITEIFNPKKGDLIRFYNHDSERFPFSYVFEREIINIYHPTQFPGTGSNGTGSYAGRLVFEVNEVNSTTITLPPDIPSQACINNPTGSGIGHILNFIMLAKIPDETNVILIADKKSGQTSPGILLPEFLDEKTKDDAGNIVKRLKSQNLLDIFTSNNN